MTTPTRRRGTGAARPAPLPARPYAHRLLPALPPVSVVVLAAAGAAAVAGATALVHPLAPLFVAAALAAVVAAWQRPVVAAVTVVAVVPALSGLSRGFPVPFFKASEVLLLLSVTVVVLRRPVLGQRFRAADWALGAFAVAGAVFGLLHVLSGASAPSSFLRVGLQPTMLFMTWWAASRAVRGERDLVVVLRWLVLTSAVPALLTLLQAVDAPGVRTLLIRVTGGPLLAEAGVPGVVRATGPFPIWHSLAAYLLPAVAIGVLLLLRRERRVLPLPVLAGVLALDLAALLMALTITVIVWAVVGVLVLAALQRRLPQALALMALVGVAGAVLLSGPLTARFEEQFGGRSATSSAEVPQTLGYRVQVWQRDFLPLVERAVPYGVGNELPESVLFSNTENQYLTLVLRGGVLLLLSGSAAMIAAAGAVGRAARRTGELAGGAAGAAFGLVLFLPVAAMIWPYLTNAGFPQSWLSLAGAAVGAAAGSRRTA